MMLRVLVVAVLVCTCGSMALGDDASVLLRYRIAADSQLHYQNATRHQESYQIGAVAIEGPINESETEFVYELYEMDEQGNMVVGRTYQQLKEKVTLPNGATYQFNSRDAEHDETSALGKKYTPTNLALQGSRVKVTLNELGKCLGAADFRELLEPVLEKNADAAQQVNGGGNEHEVYAVTLRFPVLPAEAVKPGVKWESPIEVTFGPNYYVKGKRSYVFEGWDTTNQGRLARIKFTTQLTFRVEKIEGDAKVVSDYKTVASSGEALFHAERGHLHFLRDKFETDGEDSIFLNGKEIRKLGRKTVQQIETKLQVE